MIILQTGSIKLKKLTPKEIRVAMVSLEALIGMVEKFKKDGILSLEGSVHEISEQVKLSSVTSSKMFGTWLQMTIDGNSNETLEASYRVWSLINCKSSIDWIVAAMSINAIMLIRDYQSTKDLEVHEIRMFLGAFLGPEFYSSNAILKSHTGS